VARKIDCRRPFAALLDELREEGRRTRGRGVTAITGQVADVDPRIETRVVSEPSAALHAASGGRWIAALALHSLGLLAVLGLPLLRSDDLPSPVAVTRAFFVQPALAPPQPPPPPPAPRAKLVPRSKTPPVVSPGQTFTAPVRIPDQVKPEEIVEAVPVAGEAGGVEGGVAGGVVGGVIGGLPQSRPPAPPARLRAGIDVKEPTKVKNVDPVYPDIAGRANIQGVVILELMISPDGRVADVKVLRSVPLLDDAAVAAVRQWVYTPTLLDGVPVSAFMTVTVRFSLRASRSSAGRPDLQAARATER
jgi:protein TonB